MIIKKNSKGVAPVDQVVYNNYKYGDEKNPHKAYGYLRTEQVAETIVNFLTTDRNPVFVRLGEKLESIKKRFGF